MKQREEARDLTITEHLNELESVYGKSIQEVAQEALQRLTMDEFIRHCLYLRPTEELRLLLIDSYGIGYNEDICQSD